MLAVDLATSRDHLQRASELIGAGRAEEVPSVGGVVHPSPFWKMCDQALRFASAAVLSPKRSTLAPMRWSIETYRLQSGVFFS